MSARGRRLSEISALIYSVTNVGGVELRAGRRSGRAKLEQAIALAQRHGLEDQAARAIALVVSCCLRTRYLALAEHYLDRGFEYCADADLDDWRWLLAGLPCAS